MRARIEWIEESEQGWGAVDRKAWLGRERWVYWASGSVYPGLGRQGGELTGLGILV